VGQEVGERQGEFGEEEEGEEEDAELADPYYPLDVLGPGHRQQGQSHNPAQILNRKPIQHNPIRIPRIPPLPARPTKREHQ
jgi:hypothetical protein